MRDYEFELDGFTWGPFADVILDGHDAFDTGTVTLRSQDSAFAQGDGVQFGRDFREGQTWSWKLLTNRQTPEEALDTLGTFSALWAADRVRSKPGAVLPLKYRVGGRERRVYGRPGRLAAPPNNRILSGVVPITCDFRCADGLTYDEEPDQATVSLQPAVEGGFGFPLVFPLITAEIVGSREGEIVVGGTAATWPVVTIHGPVINPRVALLNEPWEIGLDYSLAAGESVVIDTHPWARTAVRSDGGSLGGYLTRKTRLSTAQLTPGRHSFVFRGTDETGTARATIAWRNASHSL